VYLPRPKTVTREYPTGRQDGDEDKYLRAIQDALSLAGVYYDDSLVVDGHIHKRYADGRPTGATIRIAADERARSAAVSQSDAAVEQMLEAAESLSKISRYDVQYGMKKLRAWRRLALAGLPFAEGDRVAIADTFRPIESSSGWWSYRECLVPGQTCTVRSFDIRPDDDRPRVFAEIMLDTEWSVGGNWPSAPRYYISEPQRRHLFMFWVGELRPLCEHDEALPLPVIEESA
jgi:hypothetical protein